MVDAVLDGFADAKHHGCSRSHAELMCSAMDLKPVRSQALQTRDFVADFVVENFSSSAGDGIKPRVAQPRNRVAHAEIAVFGNRQNFRSGIAVQMNFWKAL